MSIDEMIAVLQAAKQGKQIECKAYSSSAPLGINQTAGSCLEFLRRRV